MKLLTFQNPFNKLQTLVIRLHVDRTHYAIMEFVHAFLSIKVILTACADQSVFLIMNVLKIKHA